MILEVVSSRPIALHALQVKEIIYPGGAEIDIRAIKVGDPSMSVMEIWGAEYQENDCVLIMPGARDLLQGVCDRERCIMQVRGFLCLRIGFRAQGVLVVYYARSSMYVWLICTCLRMLGTTADTGQRACACTLPEDA